MAINFKKGLLSDMLQDEQFLVAAGLLSGGSQGQSIGQAAFPAILQAAQIQKAFAPEDKERKIIKGADGFQYYADDGSRVLPNVVQEKKEDNERETKNPIEKKQKVSRNSPCTCGSGKKYKHCCGRAA